MRSLLLFASWLGLTAAALAQSPEEVKPPGGAARSFEQLHADYEALNQHMELVVKQIQKTPEEERGKLIEQYRQGIAQFEQLMPRLFASARAAYLTAPNKNPQVTEVVVGNLEYLLGRDDYETGRELLNVLLEHKCPAKDLNELAGVTAFALNDFEAAGKFFALAKQDNLLSPRGEAAAAETEVYKKYWEKEKALREAEAKANDLPLVKLETSQGTMLIELFENEAPHTVGNFIHLVEKKYYDGLSFHRVLPGFMAQGGCPDGNGAGGPGYRIHCECDRADYRKHFRGTLSMAHAGKNTGGSQFFLTFVPTPHLNGKHTAFGRVVEGLDVLARLQRIDPQRGDPNVQPDRILKATVERKRAHIYEPAKVK